MHQYNCIGCHEIERRGGFIRKYYQENPTLAPPILNGEGEKVQSQWLFSFLKAPIPIRPWLQAQDADVRFVRRSREASWSTSFNGLSKVEVPFAYL